MLVKGLTFKFYRSINLIIVDEQINITEFTILNRQ